MQRVYYEVSALLPAMAKLIQDYEGAVTEYLGDGLLALFQSSRNIDERNQILKNTVTAARGCMDSLNEVVNPILYQRYGLPSLEIGIGLAYSDAIISHFGLHPDTQIKVIGECIYLASQLSKGRNEIIVHENLEMIWPSSKDGKLKFTMRPFKDFKGYIVNE
jgi:class 3 adenylate cyclase